jgi:hypothetical protein
MPKVEFALLADYARSDAGVVHIMGAGIDTITAPVVPTAQPVNLVVQLSFGSDEQPGTEHQLQVIFNGEDAQLASVRARFFVPPQPPGIPVHWRTKVILVLGLNLPIPRYGDYSLEVVIDDEPPISLDLRAIQPTEAQGSAPA